MKKKKIMCDADFLIFQVAEGAYIKDNTFANEKVDLKPFKKRFKQLAKDIENEIAVETLGTFKIKGKLKLMFSDPKTNFRYKLDPNYKISRKGSTRSDTFYRMRKWALKKYGYVKNVECDDVVSHYARKGWIIATFDKDVKFSTMGDYFDVYHTRRCMLHTTQLEADRFTLIQTLTGDPTDSILGLPRVAEKTAIKLLDEFGWDWSGVVASYESKGLTEKDAILTRRLIGMDQWHPKKGITLWKP